MPTKFLNAIIIVSLIGIGLISIKDAIFAENTSDNLENTKVNEPQEIPDIEITEKSSSTLVSCSNTFLGNIQKEKLSYDVSYSDSDETISMNRIDEDESFITFVADSSNLENSLTFTCNSDFIIADTMGFEISLVPSNDDIKVGDNWDTDIDTFGILNIQITHVVESIETVTVDGNEEQAVDVVMSADSLGEIANYTVVSNIGIARFAANESIASIDGEVPLAMTLDGF